MSDLLKPSIPRLILVRELANGPKTHKALRVAYFGVGRAEGNSANTSFYNKLVAACKEGLIQKVSIGIFAIDVKGEELLAYAKEQKLDLTVLKSQAQELWESQHS